MLIRAARHSRRAFVLAASLSLVLVMSSGCTSQAEKKRGVATGALKDFRASLDTFDGRVEASVRAIDRLQSTSTYDLSQAYQGFLSEYFNVSADATEVNQRAEAMRDTGADYYITARNQAAADKDVRAAESLQQRQLATREAYDVLQQRLGELRESYRLYQLQLEGVRRALSRDQSRERIAAVATPLLEAREQAGRVRRAIGSAKEQTDKVAEAGALPKK
jgi:hypothetical protein